VRRITDDERRARLGRRHLLAAGAQVDDVVDVARGLVALHATDPASVYLSAWARLRRPDPPAVERALYDDRTVLRMLGMRRTMFVIPTDFAPVVQAACTNTIAERERRKFVQQLEQFGIAADGLAWLDEVDRKTLAALAARGDALASELSTDVPELRSKYEYGQGKAYGATVTVTSRALNVLSMAGHIVRGRPRGNWNGSQYRWAPMTSWLPAGLPDMAREAAQAELVGAWLAAFGPGTIEDLKWWTGLNLGEVRKARSSSTAVRPDWCSPATTSRWRRPSHGWRCCRRSTRPRWGGPGGPGTWVSTAAPCSTARATSVRPCGATGASSGAGVSAGPGPTPAPSWSASSRTSAPRPRPGSRRWRPISPPGTARSGSPRASARRSSVS
jgi:hypothetical protein